MPLIRTIRFKSCRLLPYLLVRYYVGVTTGGVNFGIPYRGGFLALGQAQTGEQRWRFEVDPEAGANRTLNRGCGNVWSSPALDPKSQMVFFGTADCEEQPLPPYHGSVLALDAKTGHLSWVFRARGDRSLQVRL